MSIDNISIIKSWVDASHATHHDMRGHTGGCITLGKGTLYTKSSKQKINTKSSTEAELVGASDYMPNTIWSKMFLEAQGHKITNNDFEQDNVSAIRLEKNGRSSAGKKSRHIDIRYFFIKDRIRSDGINVRHCPTEQMLADFLTKPLQGNLFRKFQRVLLGYQHIDTLSKDTSISPSPEERVGKNEYLIKSDRKVSILDSVENRSSKNKENNARKIKCSTDSTEGEWTLVQNKTKRKDTRTTNRSTKVVLKGGSFQSNHNFGNNPQYQFN